LQNIFEEKANTFSMWSERRALRAAIYARVSTKDRGQDTENQLIQLRDYCTRHAWTYVEYIDHATGKTGERDAFKRMFADASRRQFDVVVVWALDRFTREGVLETFEYIRDLTKYGVQFESYSEAHFRTTGPAGELMLAISAWIAKQERLRISERTKAGLARARKQGKVCGRPRTVFARDRALELRSSGMSWMQISRTLKVAQSTIRRALGATK
jgi:DNA invertase Pin-like site-specific DNA recombinase